MEAYLNGEALHALGKQHDVCRSLIRIWIEKYERGEYDDDAVEADLLPEYESRIAALERLVGRQALEIEFLKGAQKRGKSAKEWSDADVERFMGLVQDEMSLAEIASDLGRSLAEVEAWSAKQFGRGLFPGSAGRASEGQEDDGPSSGPAA